MNQHDCKHETDLLKMQISIENMEPKVKDIHIALLGEKGKGGLVTATELNSSAINRLWWAFRIVFTGIVGLAFYIIKGGFKP